MKTENPYFNESASDFLPIFNASPQLWKIFTQNGFKPQVGFSHLEHFSQYEPGKMTHLRKNGECMVVFLKDGRVHVMNGPLSRWHLFDKLNIATLRCLLAFASLSDIDQFSFRNYMKDRCTHFSDIFNHLPGNNVGWKHRFLNQYSAFPAVELYAFTR